MSGAYADAFRKTVEEEQAAVKAEQEQRRLVKEAAARQLKEARRAAQAIRDRILQPMLTSLCENLQARKSVAPLGGQAGRRRQSVLCAADGAATPARRQIRGSAGAASRNGMTMTSRSPPAEDRTSRGRSSPSAPASRSSDGGPSLSMAVLLPKELGESHPGVNTKDIVEARDGQCDESTVALWYQTRLEDCARRVVRFAAEEQKP